MNSNIIKVLIAVQILILVTYGHLKIIQPESLLEKRNNKKGFRFRYILLSNF